MTLAQTAEPPDILLRRCRERIDLAAPEEQANLAAVAQVMAALRYNDLSLLNILGGRQAMIESPVLIELLDETRREFAHQMILRILASQFGLMPDPLAAQIRAIQALDRLEGLIEHAANCQDLDGFRARLAS